MCLFCECQKSLNFFFFKSKKYQSIISLTKEQKLNFGGSYKYNLSLRSDSSLNNPQTSERRQFFCEDKKLTC
jgi:hypothetical protein